MFDRATTARPSLRFVNDGGRDAPMDRSSNRLWWSVAVAVVVLVVVATAVSAIVG